MPEARDALPERFRRAEPPRLPEVSEPELVRHYVRLSKKNFDLDSGFYPLGSCTMKHNPRLHERVAALPGHARLHPLQDPARAQGALELMWNLERALAEVAGLPHVSLQPSAGSHGELAGVLLTKAYHADRGEPQRTKVLTPDTAHGTNPATVTMAGLEVVKVATNPDGGVDLDDLRAKAGDDTACLMLTNPNTLGIFDPNIEEIASIVHAAGGDALLRRREPQRGHGHLAPRRHGLRHRALQPAQVLHPAARRRRAGLGPDRGHRPDRAVPDEPADRARRGRRLRPRRRPRASRSGGCAASRATTAASCAPTPTSARSAPRACATPRETAVLNANYLLARLRQLGVAEHLPLAFGELCMHEFVLSGGPMKRELKIKTLDLAKRLLDHGFHPPTVYFPLLVDEALLVEPTETETRETLDAFAEALADILREAAEDPTIAQNAPYTTPVRRLDEAGAAKRPVIRQAL